MGRRDGRREWGKGGDGGGRRGSGRVGRGLGERGVEERGRRRKEEEEEGEEKRESRREKQWNGGEWEKWKMRREGELWIRRREVGKLKRCPQKNREGRRTKQTKSLLQWDKNLYFKSAGTNKSDR